ncbi:hypothetical protein LTR09_012074 [Extremus antarcticus]|uniref:Uncharacterized protein n=1 Tax=Extremus antarcticus TaxID=702011 RepID=A0AAJ0DAP9_9PEZI|nr:hypothetical protein LTR09_012074 [Extremus antarcticus]
MSLRRPARKSLAEEKNAGPKSRQELQREAQRSGSRHRERGKARFKELEDELAAQSQRAKRFEAECQSLQELWAADQSFLEDLERYTKSLENEVARLREQEAYSLITSASDEATVSASLSAGDENAVLGAEIRRANASKIHVRPMPLGS